MVYNVLVTYDKLKIVKNDKLKIVKNDFYIFFLSSEEALLNGGFWGNVFGGTCLSLFSSFESQNKELLYQK